MQPDRAPCCPVAAQDELARIWPSDTISLVYSDEIYDRLAYGDTGTAR